MLARLRGQRAAAAQALRLRIDELSRELGDEGRHVAELSEAAETLQRGNLVVEQAFVGGGERKLPGGVLDLGGELLERRWGWAGSHDVIMDRDEDAKT
jgi:hypothetical protein